VAQAQASDLPKSAPVKLTLIPEIFAGLGRRHMLDYVAAQNEFIDKIQAAYREWFDYAHAETRLASEFASGLMDAHSVPEMMAVYQRVANHQFEAWRAHGAHLFEDTQRLMKAEADLVLDGWKPNKKAA
jgi:hypothetical protein